MPSIDNLFVQNMFRNSDVVHTDKFLKNVLHSLQSAKCTQDQLYLDLQGNTDQND